MLWVLRWVGYVSVIQGIRAKRTIHFVYILSEEFSFNREESLQK